MNCGEYACVPQKNTQENFGDIVRPYQQPKTQRRLEPIQENVVDHQSSGSIQIWNYQTQGQIAGEETHQDRSNCPIWSVSEELHRPNFRPPTSTTKEQ